MKKLLLNIYRGIVGPEVGFFGEGNEQWYYFLSLIINAMLVGMFEPHVAVGFILLMLIHFTMVCIYGYNALDAMDACNPYGPTYAYRYFGIHLVLMVVALILSPLLALITTAISITAFFAAPNFTGSNAFLAGKSGNIKLPLVFNTVIFGVFVIITLMLPTDLWSKILMIIGVMIIHPIIDCFATQGIDIYYVTDNLLFNIKEYRKYK